jgi:meiotically up-regulated gene 157 (Mug157) protein
LAHGLWKSGASAPNGTPPLFDFAFKLALEKMVVQYKLEQDHENSTYRYRQTDGGPHGGPPNPPILPRQGLGNATNYTGMTWVGFRPSDDASAKFNVPVNGLVAVAMRKTAELCRAIYGDAVLAALADGLAKEIEDGIATHGTMSAPGSKTASKVSEAEASDGSEAHEVIYAYETDGLGNYSALDDANTPSLLSLPYFGFKGDPRIMNRTRRWVLSKANPWFMTGRCATGIGSAHTGSHVQPIIWPMGLISQAITSDDDSEVGTMLQMLLNSDCGTGYMHESFQANNGCKITRKYFGWPNSYFAELIDKLLATGRLTAKMLSLPRSQCGGKP